MSEAENNKAVVQRWFEEVWNQGRAESIDALFAEDGVSHGLGEAGVEVRGPAAFKPFLERLRGAFPDIHFTVEDTLAEGDRVAARWRAEMTHRGDHLGLPASGRQAEVTGMSIVRIADGKIVEGWNNWDMMGLMQQIGEGAEVKLL
jgi:steroid delta-isomerase-like uncharacterized protein